MSEYADEHRESLEEKQKRLERIEQRIEREQESQRKEDHQKSGDKLKEAIVAWKQANVDAHTVFTKMNLRHPELVEEISQLFDVAVRLGETEMNVEECEKHGRNQALFLDSPCNPAEVAYIRVFHLMMACGKGKQEAVEQVASDLKKKDGTTYSTKQIYNLLNKSEQLHSDPPEPSPDLLEGMSEEEREFISELVFSQANQDQEHFRYRHPSPSQKALWASLRDDEEFRELRTRFANSEKSYWRKMAEKIYKTPLKH